MAYSLQKKGSADEIAFLTVKHMDFFKGEPTTDVLPGIFDDGLLQKVRWSRVAPALTARSFLGGSAVPFVGEASSEANPRNLLPLGNRGGSGRANA